MRQLSTVFATSFWPWLLAAALPVAAGLFAGGYWLGRDHALTACRADKADALRRLIDEQARIAEQDREILLAHEVRQARIRTVFRPILQEAGRYALQHNSGNGCGLDADGLRLWRAANAAEAQAAAESDYSLPVTAAARLGTAGGSVAESRRDGGAVPHLPRASTGAGGLGEE